MYLIKAAVMALWSGCAPGINEISAEMLKYGGQALIDKMTALMNRYRKASSVPADWRWGVIVLPKKGNLADCNNWWGIMLLSVPGKVLCSVLFRYLRQVTMHYCERSRLVSEVGDYALNKFLSWGIISSNAPSSNGSYQLISIHRETQWKIVQSYGFPAKFVDILRNIYYETSCCVLMGRGNSDYFWTNTGVRQGCMISPFLFILALDFVLDRFAWDRW